MHVGRNRIFVGNLPPLINENEIKEQFGQYGNVVSVEIKQRKENSQINENVSPVFAFVSIETDKDQLYECFQSLPNYNWNGYYVKLELAKESFLERLKREREEAAQKTPQPQIVQSIPDNNLTPSTLLNKTNNNKKVYSSSDSSSSSSSSDEDNDDDNKKPALSNGTSKQNKINKIVDKPDPDLVIKNNKNKQLTNGKIQIESVNNSTPIHVIKIKPNGLQKDGEKLTPADEKRLNSLYKLKESYNQQKSLIKNALLQIDTTNKNKILFDEDGKQSHINNNNNNNNNKRKQNYDYDNKKSKKVSLFADEEEDDSINFEIRNQFEGRKGQRLLELQSRYTNDKRFTLDSRFNEEDDDYYNEEPVNNEEDEKQKQLEILENVIGRKIHKTPIEDPNTKKNMPRGMLRYDPTNVEHSKFEIKDKPSEKNIEETVTNDEQQIEETPVEVSKEKFYKVTDNLKQAFKESEGFSLLSMFGRTEEDKVQVEHTESTINKKIDNNQRNPFRYDSSDTEDEDTNKKSTSQITHNTQRANNFSFRNISGEKFFFQNEDERLKDGLTFLKKFGGNSNSMESAAKFTETRREIKEILRSKLRHVQRNNRPFRKKIGQHKHIKIKKAKKN